MSKIRLWDSDNLARAWRWVRSNPDRGYKTYFRELYSAYAVADDALLQHLGDRIKRGIYHPTDATKIFFPKASGILRPYSLLSVEDQIAYQAAVNVVAEQLSPKVRHRYGKDVFGHLYAGKSSVWFYRKWSDGYRMFNDAAIQAFKDGMRFTASFDLTACYDSIDHSVLRHFMQEIGCDKAFCETLTDWLSVWTGTETRILHNHGIPQGPLGSGLLAEVVLQHFDDHRGREQSVRYMRYVDDIRLFAKREEDLRHMLVRLDRLSKDIGLFPQSGKIDIHPVKDIHAELKSVSQPVESVIHSKMIHQDQLLKRLVQLTPSYNVTDQTRFKYLLAHSMPSAKLTARMWRIFENAPHLYDPFSRYLSRYTTIPAAPASRLLAEIEGQKLYPAIAAGFIRSIDGRLREDMQDLARKKLKPLWKPKIQQADFSAALGQWLVRDGIFTDSQIRYATTHPKSWWLRAQLFLAFHEGFPASHLRTVLINQGLRDKDHDVALAAAWLAGRYGIKPNPPISSLHPTAKLVLRQFGLVRRANANICGIHISMARMVGTVSPVRWKGLFAKDYRKVERQLVEAHAYSETSATAWVNAMDVFCDWLLTALTRKDKSLCVYQQGNVGGFMNSATLKKLYPATQAFVLDIHQMRYQSNLSHAKVGKTDKATGPIRFSYLRRGKKLLRQAIAELSIKLPG